MVPTLTGKSGRRQSIFQSGESDFTKVGKVREIYPKYWKMRKNYAGKLKKILEKFEKFVKPVTVKILQIYGTLL